MNQGMLKDAFINRFNVDESNFVQNYAAIVTKKGDKKKILHVLVPLCFFLMPLHMQVLWAKR